MSHDNKNCFPYQLNDLPEAISPHLNYVIRYAFKVDVDALMNKLNDLNESVKHHNSAHPNNTYALSYLLSVRVGACNKLVSPDECAEHTMLEFIDVLIKNPKTNESAKKELAAAAVKLREYGAPESFKTAWVPGFWNRFKYTTVKDEPKKESTVTPR